MSRRHRYVEGRRVLTGLFGFRLRAGASQHEVRYLRRRNVGCVLREWAEMEIILKQ